MVFWSILSLTETNGKRVTRGVLVCQYTHPRVQVKMLNHAGCLPAGVKLALSCIVLDIVLTKLTY